MSARNREAFSRAFKAPGQALSPEEQRQLDLESDDPQVRNMAVMDAASDKLKNIQPSADPSMKPNAMGLRGEADPDAAGYGSLWGFGQKPSSAGDVDVNTMTPDELIRYYQAQNAKKK